MTYHKASRTIIVLTIGLFLLGSDLQNDLVMVRRIARES